METQDKQNLKKKAFAISTLMGNPKLAQSIWDSFSSPVGSTKNTKAKSILYSMKRANNIQDGKGGPGTLWDQWSANNNLFSQAGSNQSQQSTPVQGVGQSIRAGIDAAFDPRKSPMMQGTPAYEKSQIARQQNSKIIRGVDDMINWSASPESVEGKSRLETGVGWLGKKIVGAPKSAEEAMGFVQKNVIYPWTSLISATGQDLLSSPYRLGSYLTDPTRGPLEQGIGPLEKGKEYDFFPYGHKTPASQKKYYREAGTDEVYDSKTHKHITEKEAAKISNFWNQVDEVEKFSLSGKSWTPTGEESRMSSATQRKTSVEDSTQRYKDLLMTGQDPTAAAYEAKWQTGFDPDTTTVKKELEQDPKTNAEFGLNTIDGMTPEQREEWWNGLDSSEQDFWRSSYEASGTPMDIFTAAQEASDLGLTAEWFSQTYMRDKKKLAELLGIPEEQAHMLPEGMLSEQLADLRDSIKSEYRLDEQRDELYKLQKRDLDITDKFITYIHNKDEYLNEVSGLLDGAEKRIASMDTSNPYVAKRMQMYVNHLTILQGRQNQRYIDFLDTGVKHHKNQLDSLTLNINRDIALADEQWREDKPKTEESWNNMKDMLEGIFNNITARDDRAFKLEERKAWRIEAAGKASGLVLDNKLKTAKLFGGSANVEINASTAGMITDMYLAEDNEDGTLNFTTYNPNEVRYSADLAKAGSSDHAFNAFMKDMGYTVGKDIGNGSLAQFEKFKKSMTENLANNLKVLPEITEEEFKKMSPEEQQKTLDEYTLNDDTLMDFNRMHSQLQTNLQAGIKDYLSSTEEKIKALRSAIDDLGKKEGGWFGWGKVNREGFMKEHGGALGKFATPLFDYTEDTLKSSPGKKSKDVWGDIPDEFLPETVSRELANYLML